MHENHDYLMLMTRNNTINTNTAYKAKGSYIWLLSLISLLLIGYIHFFTSTTSDSNSIISYIEICILFSILAIIWYINFIYPKFIIDGTKLIVKKAFSKIEIDINNIQRIETNYIDFNFRVILFSPYKVGLKVVYNKFDDIFIHPDQTSEFLKKLHQIKPSIIVK